MGIFTFACKTQQPTQQAQEKPCPTTIKQGIVGKVLWKEGDFMPSPDNKTPNQAKPIKRNLLIYKLTNESQTTKDERFYKTIKSPIVKMIASDANGCFEVALPEGTYSIFSVEEKGYYANSFDGEMNIFPVKVEKDKTTSVSFIIDYMATY